MTKEELKELNIDELEARSAAIAEELANAEVAPETVEERNAELDLIEERKKEIALEIETRKKDVAAVVSGQGDVIEKPIQEERKMTDKEIRNSKAYIDAFAEYIKTGKDDECRALLTTENDATPNGTASIAVPELVYEIVKNAWEKDGIMSLVKKTYLKGNLKVNFEISGDDAVVHAEGAAAISPENLIIGMVELKPDYIKKVLPVTKQIASLRGEEFLRYVYEEVAYRIAKKAADELLAKIVAAGTASTTTAVGVPVITSTTISLSLIASAMAQLSAEAVNPVIIMNRQTWGQFKAAQAAANFAYDPFEGLPVLFNNSLSSFSAATTGVTYAVVGDLGEGALANFPNGEEIEWTYDFYTRKKENIVEIMGEQYVGLGIIGPNAFVKITH